jgi:hypothetical protein
MFDWDKDFESVIAGAKIDIAPTSAERTGVIRAFTARWLAPTAVVVGLILAGQSVFRLDLVPSSSSAVTLSSAGGLRAALFQANPDERPAELLIYEDAQYESFMRGIVEFSDADLLEYAATTARELGRDDDVMTPYLLDVLWLTNRQIERRGLSRPMMMVAYETQRESFSALQPAL